MNERTFGNTVVLTPHELFWLEVIRLASNDGDPMPTLDRTQKLRRLFSEAGPASAWNEVHHGR